MYGDFTRLTYQALNGFSAVLKQQGRVALDADDNENTAILLHLVRTLAEDLIGPFGGRDGSASFEVAIDASGNRINDLKISPGHYYVHGLLVDLPPSEADASVGTTYYTQPFAYLNKQQAGDTLPNLPFLLYLKVWEESLSSLQSPAIREKALGNYGPDTALRSRIAWKLVATNEVPGVGTKLKRDTPAATVQDAWIKGQEVLRNQIKGRLQAQVTSPSNVENDVCILNPESRYRGRENQLYRVEVHTGGQLDDKGQVVPANGPVPSFKWSRDNGSVTFPIVSLDGKEVAVASLGRDDRCTLSPGDWVEICDDAYSHRGQPTTLLQVMDVDRVEDRVTLSDDPGRAVGTNALLHPYLRRWDQKPQKKPATSTALTLSDVDKAALIVPDTGKGSWLELEDGILVQFTPGAYTTGDYWLIPARVIDGSIEWPVKADGTAQPLSPFGVQVYYAPIAVVQSTTKVDDLRTLFRGVQ